MMHSLQGLRILNTRPANQAAALSLAIHEAGGIALECPTLQIQATDTDWIHILPDLNKIDQAIFISPNAVDYCFTQLIKNEIDWPATIKVVAIGPGSAKALRAFNIHVDAVPDTPDSEHLLKLPSMRQLKNQTVLLFKGIGGRRLIEQELMHKGAQVLSIPVYQRVMPDFDPQFIAALWSEDLVDIIVLTSEQSIHNLFKMFGKEAHPWLQNKACLVLSERLAKAASLYGMKEIIISHPDKMIRTLFDYKD